MGFKPQYIYGCTHPVKKTEIKVNWSHKSHTHYKTKSSAKIEAIPLQKVHIQQTSKLYTTDILNAY